MAGKAFIHINGFDYENAYPMEGNQSPEFQDLERKVQKLTSGGGTQVTFDVILEDARTTLHVTAQGVFAGAVTFKEEGEHGAVIHR